MKFTLFLKITIVLLASACLAQSDNPLFAITVNGQEGFIDDTGKVIIKPQFLQCIGKTRFVDNLTVACTKDNNKAGFIDKTGKFVIEQKFAGARNFSEGLAVVYFGEFALHSGYESAGFIDKTGKIVIEPIFQDAEDFSEGLAVVQKDGKSGFIDKTGKIVIPLQFDYAFSFSEGLAAVFIKDKYGFIDRTGKIIIEPQFTFAGNFSEGIAFVKHNGKTVYPYSTHQEVEIIGRPNYTYAYLDKKGQILYKFASDSVGSFSEGLAAIFVSNLKSSFSFSKALTGKEVIGNYGFIDKTGKFVIQPKFPSVFGTTPHFSEGLSLTILKNNKIGFIDKKGKVVIKTKYKYAFDFEDGLAQVCEQTINTCGYIDKKGKLIWKPTK